MDMRIMQRTAQDGYHALLIAQGMENAGADVFSITNDLSGYLQVYCKHDRDISEDAIDRRISAEVSDKAACYA